ncbi:homocysteine S-methyltransferase [Niallia nealsonii]|uniref:S-methylmethionine:homocysteine methyltransferase n=1 Tax=Niallia nealsonii TaxID=115979 RepID=A0A2N0Z1T4_9BACI|nr:homocysteine S-methyltransferase [Niallia nealsonii]PKG23466.1 homocysteine S-methyltransferase [Niallia nealsonii]
MKKKPNPIQQIIDTYKSVILDGAIATEIEKKGININDSLWSAKAIIDNPAAIKEVHVEYFAAGSDVATTNTYQANIDGFIQKGYTKEEAERLLEDTALAAIEARNSFWGALSESEKETRPFPLVAGSIGPYGAFLADGSEYTGDYSLTDQAFESFHLPRMKLLEEAKCDVFAFETIPSFKESIALANMLKNYFPSMTAWLSFSIRDGSHLSDGTPLSEAAAFFNSFSNISAIGVNCTAAVNIKEVLDTLKIATDKPLIVYPNAGGVYDGSTKMWTEEEKNNNFGEMTKCWHEDGAVLIGGCCRTTPEHIRQIANWARD